MSKTYAYRSTLLLEHADKTYPALAQIAGFDNLYEGQVIEDVMELIQKIRFFKKYSKSQGMYITDHTYSEYGSKGLHFYRWDTMLHAIEMAKAKDVYGNIREYQMKICFDTGLRLKFERKGEKQNA